MTRLHLKGSKGEQAALDAAMDPSADNPLATMADVGGGIPTLADVLAEGNEGASAAAVTQSTGSNNANAQTQASTVAGIADVQNVATTGTGQAIAGGSAQATDVAGTAYTSALASQGATTRGLDVAIGSADDYVNLYDIDGSTGLPGEVAGNDGNGNVKWQAPPAWVEYEPAIQIGVAEFVTALGNGVAKGWYRLSGAPGEQTMDVNISFTSGSTTEFGPHDAVFLLPAGWTPRARANYQQWQGVAAVSLGTIDGTPINANFFGVCVNVSNVFLPKASGGAFSGIQHMQFGLGFLAATPDQGDDVEVFISIQLEVEPVP